MFCNKIFVIPSIVEGPTLCAQIDNPYEIWQYLGESDLDPSAAVRVPHVV